MTARAIARELGIVSGGDIERDVVHARATPEDKNEDYVLVWETEYTKDKAGKSDSTVNHSYYQIKDNKIAVWSEYLQKNPGSGTMMKN